MADSAATALEIDGLRVEYGRKRGKVTPAVRGLSLRVGRGEVVGFIGPNGAGKTTTIKVLMGFRRPDAGSATIFGSACGDGAARRRVGYLPEVAQYYPFLTAREALRLYAVLSEVPKGARPGVTDAVLDRVGLRARADEPLKTYSKGMLQRLGIAQAILGDPDLLILDEVNSGLDPVARHDVRNILIDYKERGRTVFFSSHELSEVALICDRVVLVDCGRVVVERTTSDLLASLRRHLVTAVSSPTDRPLPANVSVRGGADGHVTYQACGSAALDGLREHLLAAGARIASVVEEPASLEDFFVQTVGHKVS